jgi:hypothetical protein
MVHTQQYLNGWSAATVFMAGNWAILASVPDATGVLRWSLEFDAVS